MLVIYEWSEQVKTLTLKLPEILEAQLNAMAHKKGLNKSEIVRRALTDYFSRDFVHNSGTLIDLANDVAKTIQHGL